MSSSQVLVVGAGPTGLTLACSLLLHGVSVRVLDRADGPATTSRANFVHARGSEVLHRIGALGDLPDRAVRANQITTYLGDRPVMKLRFGDPGLRTAAPPMVISQAEVEAALRRRLTELGGTIEWNAALTALTQDAAGVTAELGDGSTVRADWLVGCDGTSSATRKLAGITAPGVRLSERFLLADLHLDTDLDRSGTTGWIHPDGMLGAMPMPEDGRDDLWRLIAYDPGNDDRRSTDEEVLRRIQHILSTRTRRSTIKIIDHLWLSNFTVHRRLADRYRAGRILLAGDAAHAHAPFGGQGMLTGLGDAENLGWKLGLVARGRAADPLLDTYQAERRPLATEVLRGTSTVTKINVAENPFGRFLRDRILVKAFNRPRVQRWTTYTASQLWVSYRRGPLGGGRFGSSPRVGDRVGHLDCVTPTGERVALHSRMGGCWVLLLPTGATADLAGSVGERLGDRVQLLQRTDGRNDVWLVRPDGHLGWRGSVDGSDAVALGTWLDSVLQQGRRPDRTARRRDPMVAGVSG